MGVRERVQEAVNASTARAETILGEAAHADEHERLTILVNGWFQGIAAALEEIALELDTRASPERETDAVTSAPPEATPSTADQPSGAAEEAEPEDGERAHGSDEEALLDRARASTKETQALRAERESERSG
jgi:hypothetical protein